MGARDRPGIGKTGCLHREKGAKGEKSKGVNTFKGQGSGVQNASFPGQNLHLKVFFPIDTYKEGVLGHQGKCDGPAPCCRGFDMDRKGGGLTGKYRQRG